MNNCLHCANWRISEKRKDGKTYLIAMAEHHYYLQYLIYCLALHRYLRLRLPGYDWETHVGGALYLFLRGMQPAQPGSGVFFHKPDTRLINALDALMSA